MIKLLNLLGIELFHLLLIWLMVLQHYILGIHILFIEI